MKNILVLNLGTTHDLITSAHFIGSYAKEYAGSNIEVVTLESNRTIAGTIANVSKVHFINDELIQNIIKNPLYSNAFALNKFMEGIGEVLDTQWDKVFNYSNDNISSFLIQAIEAETREGTLINENGVARTTNKWATYQNHVASGLNRASIDKVTVRNHLATVPFHSDVDKIKIDQDYAIVASQNFSRVRQLKGSAGTFIVGINLEAAYDGFALETETIAEVLEAIEESDDCKAVLLLNGKNFQRQMANDLNKRFNDSLVSINVETSALSSVLTNVDAFVSVSNDQLAIADTMETKCIEVREYSESFKNPAIIGSENYVIYQQDAGAIAGDILLAINEEFGTQLPISSLSTVNPTYKTLHDDFGPLFTQIRGNLNIKTELRYHLERSIHFQVMGYPQNDELISHIKTSTDHDQLMEFVSDLKTELTSTVKILLATLRSLKGVKTSKTNLNNFIGYLDTLMRMGKEDHIVGSIIRLFEGQVENIEAVDIDANIKAIETHLFELKSNLQCVTNIITDLANAEEVTEEKVTTESVNDGASISLDA